jgi:hypothetical protein
MLSPVLSKPIAKLMIFNIFFLAEFLLGFITALPKFDK